MANPPMLWENRIIGLAEVSPEDLLANPFNYRIHGEWQQQVVVGSLRETGWWKPIVVNQRTQHVVDGHGRVDWAIKEHQAVVPVLYVDLTDEEERQALALYDTAGGLAGIDTGKVNELIDEIHKPSMSVQAFLDDMRKKYQVQPKQQPNEGPAPDRMVVFTFGRYKGRVTNEVFRSFQRAYEDEARHGGDLDGVFRRWLGLKEVGD